MKPESSVNPLEVEHFDALSDHWWDLSGPLKTLHEINPLRIDFIAKHLPLAGLRCLDVGCGGGILSESLARLGVRVTGIDASQSAVDAARAHAKASGLDIDYQALPLEAYEGEAFDFIVCMELLEHVHEPASLIKGCARLLKKEAYLFLSTINRHPKAYLSVVLAAEYLLNLIPRQTHDYQNFIKPSEAAAMLREEGFDVLKLQGLGYNPLRSEAYWTQDVSVNYLISAQYHGLL